MDIDSIIDTFSTSCDATLGRPKQTDRLNAAGKFQFPGPIWYSCQAILHSFPSVIFTILVANVEVAADNCSSGECAIAFGFQGKTTVSRDVLKSVVDSLFEGCPKWKKRATR